MKYKSFYDWWKEKGAGHDDDVKELCLDAWDAAVQGTWEIAKQDAKALKAKRPIVVCLCGSTRFGDVFAKANRDETLAGRIVLTPGVNMHSDVEILSNLNEVELQKIKAKLDELHKRKIDLADEILVLNVGGYIGESTSSEIDYARKQGKKIRFLEPEIPKGEPNG